MCGHLKVTDIRRLFVKYPPFLLGNYCKSRWTLPHTSYRHMTHCLVNHYVTGRLLFAPLYRVLISPAIHNSAICDIRVVIRFLHPKNNSPMEAHGELCTVYDQNVMNEVILRQWCRMFRDGRSNVHIEERSDRPFVISDDLYQSVDQKIGERRYLTISELSCEFPQISRTLLYDIITVTLGYHHNFCARWVPKMLTYHPIVICH
jgi:hypothetical protein